MLKSAVWKICSALLVAWCLSCSGNSPHGDPSTAQITPPGNGPVTAGSPALVARYLADLKGLMAANQGAIETEVGTGDVGVYYGTSYYLMGLAAAAEGTGDTEVMAALTGYIDQMLAKSQPVVRDGHSYMEFFPLDSTGLPQTLDSFQATGPLAWTAAIIRTHPEFSTQFADAATRIEAFVDESVFQFWFDKVNGFYSDPDGPWQGGIVPWLPTDLGGWGTYPVWSDKASHLGMIATWMYQATGKTLYLEYAQRIARGFRRHVTLDGRCWIWDQGTVPTAPGQNEDGSPDTSHANREPAMVAAMYEAGIEFTLTDIQGLVATLLQRIWNQDASDPAFTNYIDGGNAEFQAASPWANGIIYHGWVMIGRYSSEALNAFATAFALIQTQPPDYLNPSLRSNSSAYGRIELAGALARDQGN
jgi:hypothetical protein